MRGERAEGQPAEVLDPVLELRPNHEPALEILREMEATPDSTVHVYTLLIIGEI